MTRDELKGQWTQLRGEVKQWWGKLTDDDLKVIEGDFDQLAGRLQERYGYSKEQAEREIDQHLSTYSPEFATAKKP